MVLDSRKYIGPDGLEERMARCDPLSSRVGPQELFIEDAFAVFPSEPAKTRFLAITNRQQIARNLPEAIGARSFARFLGRQAAFGSGFDEEVLDYLGHQATL